MHYEQLDTPALLVDLDRLERNIAAMADFAKAHAVALRPHTKTHKSPEIAKMQLDAGATGITCAKISEAEVMAAAGLSDILIANEIIGERKYERLIRLAQQVRLCIAVDSLFGARSLNSALEQANRKLDVLIEVNSGQNRCGVLPGEQTLSLAKTVSELSQLRLRGLMTHGGHSYQGTTEQGIERIGIEEGTVMVRTAELIRENGIAVETVSVGSTPTARYCGTVRGVTEIRPGTYVFNDLTQIGLFAATLNDCALSVLSTVISRPSEDRVVLDAGKKALSSDPQGRTGGPRGYGLIREWEVHISRLSEEHGVIDTDAELKIGEKVRITPNHACVVANMFDEMHGIRKGQIERLFRIEGRGKLT